MNQDLLKKLLHFLSEQGAELNSLEAQELSQNIEISSSKSWEIKDRSLIDYLVDRLLNKDKSFLGLCQKIWQTVLEPGPLFHPFFYSPLSSWSELKSTLFQSFRKILIESASQKRISCLVPEEIAHLVMLCAKNLSKSDQAIAFLNENQKHQWEMICHGAAFNASQDMTLASQNFPQTYLQTVDLKAKFQPIELSKQQLDFLYRIRARKQIELLIAKFYQLSFLDKNKSDE